MAVTPSANTVNGLTPSLTRMSSEDAPFTESQLQRFREDADAAPALRAKIERSMDGPLGVARLADEMEARCLEVIDQIGDPETRTPLPSMEQLHYPGPYREWNRILDDVRRMNLFRKAEIHCIGIGEVQFSQLEKLAKIGHGQSKNLGQ